MMGDVNVGVQGKSPRDVEKRKPRSLGGRQPGSRDRNLWQAGGIGRFVITDNYSSSPATIRIHHDNGAY